MKRGGIFYVSDHPDTPAIIKKQIVRIHLQSEKQAYTIATLEAQLQQSRDEVAVLKGQKARPVFTPSRMHEEAGKGTSTMTPIADDMIDGLVRSSELGNQAKPKRPGSAKQSKTAQLHIDNKITLQPCAIPAGSRFKGYTDFVVQDMRIRTHNTRYRLACWQTPDGRLLKARPPEALNGKHFGPTLVSYLLYQHHHCQVTQPLLHEQLCQWGIRISTGQINAILCHDKERFHQEKDALLVTGLACSDYVTVDDTGTRHEGHNGYVTHVGNENFAWFQSTLSKSRINFLELLQGGQQAYQLNEAAFAYMRKQNLSKASLDALEAQQTKRYLDTDSFNNQLKTLGITSTRHCKIATEGALLGNLQHNGVAQNLAIISDDAAQFKVLTHGLCWVHAERLIHKLFTANAQQRSEIARVRTQIWEYYAALKAYKLTPDVVQKRELEERFDSIFTQEIDYALLAALLERLHKNKSELLLVLTRPEVPLHTNGSEGDIRDYVKKYKVSGGTRNPLGRRCRDTFASLKKTCRKLGISFWEYLTDRISCSGQIPPLQQLLKQRSVKAY